MASGANSSDQNHIMQPVVSAPLYLGLFPVLDGLSRDYDRDTVQSLKSAFSITEKSAPGFTQELLNGIIQKKAPDKISYTKSLLRMSRQDSQEYSLNQKEPEYATLSTEVQKLKSILSRIPDEMDNRAKFLQTIKDTAKAIKDLLFAVNEVCRRYSTKENKKVLDIHKKEFVQCSKNFSDTLKTYFKDGSEASVFVSANQLIHQANVVLLDFKNTSPG